MKLYYTARITTKTVPDGGELHSVHLGWSSEDGQELYTSVTTGFDPKVAIDFAHAWMHGQHGIIMTALESRDYL
jgi:hypothetical protein